MMVFWIKHFVKWDTGLFLEIIGMSGPKTLCAKVTIFWWQSPLALLGRGSGLLPDMMLMVIWILILRPMATMMANRRSKTSFCLGRTTRNFILSGPLQIQLPSICSSCSNVVGLMVRWIRFLESKDGLGWPVVQTRLTLSSGKLRSIIRNQPWWLQALLRSPLLALVKFLLPASSKIWDGTVLLVIRGLLCSTVRPLSMDFLYSRTGKLSSFTKWTSPQPLLLCDYMDKQ